MTHAVLGAALAQTVTPALATRAERGRAALVGAAAGMLPDADILFRPWTDPALPWESHRHFTHALAFAPMGALVALLPFLPFRRMRERLGRLSAAALLAYASHGLLDACTSYGTHLFLPFSAARVSWDLIGIIDPVFTAILAAGTALTLLFTARAGFLARPSLAAFPAAGALLLGGADPARP